MKFGNIVDFWYCLWLNMGTSYGWEGRWPDLWIIWNFQCDNRMYTTYSNIKSWIFQHVAAAHISHSFKRIDNFNLL